MNDQSQPPTEGPPAQPVDQPTTIGVNDDLVSIISNVQAELDRLKRAQLRQEAEQAALEERARRLDEIQQECVRRREELEQAQADLCDAATAAAEQAGEIERRTDEANRREQELHDRESSINEAHAALCAGKEELEHERAQLDEQRLHLDAAQRRLELASDEAAEREQRLEQLETKLDDSLGREQTLQAQLQDATDHGASDERLAQLQAELDERERAIESLVEKARQAELIIDALNDEIERAKTERAARLDDSASLHVRRRRERLRRVRQAQHRRSQKLAQAKDAILAKVHEADRVLKQRASIAAAQVDLEHRQAKLASAGKRARGLSALFLGVLTILALGVMSWTVVSRAVPAKYIVTTTLAADDTSGALTPAQLESWRRYITELMSDPRLMEVAADRMKRRGMIELTSAGALSKRLAGGLDVASPAPGRLAISLTGSGAARTERVLDTFVASMVSVANDARQRRLDGASTVVASPPIAAEEPIDDPRIVDAGVVWAASTGLLLLLASTLWIRLSAAKKKLDEEQRDMLAVGGRPI